MTMRRNPTAEAAHVHARSAAALNKATAPSPNPSPATTSLRTDAWLLRGISSIPGELILEHGVIRFVANGSGSAWPWQLRKLEHEVGTPGLAQSIDRCDGNCVFRWPVDSVRAWAPFHYFGGGIRLGHGYVVLSFSFGRPANMDLRVYPGLPNVVKELHRQFPVVRRMRRHGKRWLAALG